MSRKNSVASRKRSTNTRKNSPEIKTTLEKLIDQHQHRHQTSSQRKAPRATTVVSYQTPEVELLLSEIKKLKVTVKNSGTTVSSLEQKVNSLTGEVIVLMQN